jgi:hypothetical protein
MSNPVIRRYFRDPAQLTKVTTEFRQLVRAINASRGEYTLQLREDSFNVYYRGSSLASVRPSGERYSVRIHRRFLEGRVLERLGEHSDGPPYGGTGDSAPDIRFYVQPADLPRFFRSENMRAIASNIARVNYSEELTFEQVLMTDNPPSETLIVIDRQIADHSWNRQMDLLALARDSASGPFYFLVIEVKMGKNPELREKVGQQLTDYMDHIRGYMDDYIDCYRMNYRQKKSMGLLGAAFPDDVQIEERVEGLVVTGGYTLRSEEATENLLREYPGVRVQIMKNVIDPIPSHL